ncbi:MAG: hypothetical protein M3305_16165 [Actinomycetota bacterium]|nr:hypothetical protein [Actinomycetota bacterium]
MLQGLGKLVFRAMPALVVWRRSKELVALIGASTLASFRVFGELLS